jgi:hypothetical protein
MFKLKDLLTESPIGNTYKKWRDKTQQTDELEMIKNAIANLDDRRYNEFIDYMLEEFPVRTASLKTDPEELDQMLNALYKYPHHAKGAGWPIVKAYFKQ